MQVSDPCNLVKFKNNASSNFRSQSGGLDTLPVPKDGL